LKKTLHSADVLAVVLGQFSFRAKPTLSPDLMPVHSEGSPLIKRQVPTSIAFVFGDRIPVLICAWSALKGKALRQTTSTWAATLKLNAAGEFQASLDPNAQCLLIYVPKRGG